MPADCGNIRHYWGVAMDSYTAMSDEAIVATTEAMKATGEKYAWELNVSDFETVMWALAIAANTEPVSDWHPAMADRASSLASGIAETLGIEMI